MLLERTTDEHGWRPARATQIAKKRKVRLAEISCDSVQLNGIHAVENGSATVSVALAGGPPARRTALIGVTARWVCTPGANVFGQRPKTAGETPALPNLTAWLRLKQTQSNLPDGFILQHSASALLLPAHLYARSGNAGKSIRLSSPLSIILCPFSISRNVKEQAPACPAFA